MKFVIKLTILQKKINSGHVHNKKYLKVEKKKKKKKKNQNKRRISMYFCTSNID